MQIKKIIPSLFFVPLFLTVTIVNAQVVGGRGNGESSPKEVKASELTKGAYNADVNLFTGGLSASYTLGSVSTPSGLSFTLTMGNSSSFSAGDNAPLTKGIPYGEGWSLNLPSITVSTESYNKYNRVKSESNNQIFNDNLFSEYSGSDAALEGTTFWFSPTINIPGVISERFIYKYTETEGAQKGALVFVPAYFEKYAEARLKDNTWSVTTEDGTVYVFGGGTASVRNASNQRYIVENVLDPQSGLYVPASPAESVFIPKMETSLNWTVSEIYHPNYPNNQRILFGYERYGAFDYYKEFQQENLQNALNHVGFNFTVHKDVLLKQVYSVESFGTTYIEKIELNYKTTIPGTTYNMLLPGQDGVSVLDNMYNYKTVYAQGINNSTERTTINTTLTEDSEPFTNWARYHHIRSNEIQQNRTDLDGKTMISSNPYIYTNASAGPDGGGVDPDPANAQQKLVRSPALVGANGNDIPFNHSFLESPLINTGIDNLPLPAGDIYQLKTIIGQTGTSNFCNFDINIVAGDGGSEDVVSGTNFQDVEYNWYQRHRNTNVFTTFNQAVKWNIGECNGGNLGVVTSNFFSLANLPAEFGGFRIQVGPGNSDHDFSLYGDGPSNANRIAPLNVTQTDNGTIPNAYLAYNNFIHSNSIDYEKYGYGCSPAPSNFGIGLEWHMMRKTYSDMYFKSCPVTYNMDDPRYKSWWNVPVADQGNNNRWDNIPTHADENVALSALELVRYSKNPYLLAYVKTYRINGIEPGKEKEVLTSMLKFDYDVVIEDIKNNVDHNPVYAQSTQEYNQKQNIFLLKRIHEIPVNSANGNDPVASISDTSKVPTTHFDYAHQQNVDPSNILSFLGLSTTPSYALTQIVDRLGGVTNYEYYEFDANHFLLNSYYNWKNLNPTHKGIWTEDIQMGRPFAIGYTLSVKKKTVADASTSTTPKEWNYTYQLGGSRVISPQNLGPHFDILSTMNEPGYLKTTVTEPLVDANPNRVRTEYTHYISEESGRLFGKLKFTESYDAGNHLIEKKEYQYSVKEAYTNGVTRSPEQMPSTFDEQKLKHHTFINGEYFQNIDPNQVPVSYLGPVVTNLNATINNGGDVLNGMRYLEQGNPNLFSASYLTSYFTPIIKQTNTEYDIQISRVGPVAIASNSTSASIINSISNLVSNISNNVSNSGSGSVGANAVPSGTTTIPLSTNWPAIALQQKLISNITEYEYWDADMFGATTCEGNKILNGLTGNDPIQLVFEPSWQLYKKKTYSPQLPDVYSIEENFYFHDLKTWANNIEGLGDTITNFDALNLCSAYLIRNLPYEMRTTTKSQGYDPVVKSSYYWYDKKFTGDLEHFYEMDETVNFTGPTCPVIDPNPNPDPNPPPAADCIVPRLNPNFPPPGYKLTITGPGYTWWCPYTSDDVPTGGAGGGGNEANIFYSPTLHDFLFLRYTAVQVDVVPKNNIGYDDPGNNYITRFASFLEGSVTTPYKPVYPYETLVNYFVEERNHYGQVKLEHDEKGLKTMYYYHPRLRVFMQDVANPCNSLLFFPKFENMGLPAAITVGFGLADSLRSTYTYNKDHSLLTMTDPNEKEMKYDYDEYGRLKNTYRNNVLLARNDYHYWENVMAQTFEQRATENYVETFTLNNLNSPAGERSRAYIDPQGRKYDVLTQVSPDYNSPTTYDSKMVHSGLTIYDNWNRSIKQYKPFETGDGINPEPFTPQFNNASADPFTQQQYENNQRSRSLRAAKFGQDIVSGYTVNSSYKLIQGNSLVTELGLNTSETALLMTGNPYLYVFLKTAAIDEDGKKVITYTDAFGRQVAVKTYIAYNSSATTLFVYNSQGQQAVVINPNKQQSIYNYNLLGQLYSKTTVDAGEVRYMYNKTGQVVLEQDANARAGTDNNAIPYLRQYTYDDFGRMVKQQRTAIDGFNPLNYQDHNLPDNTGIYPTPPTEQNDAYSVTFSNANTTDYAFKIQRLYIEQGSNNETSEDITDPYSLTASIATEKEFFYHDPLATNTTYLDSRIATYLGSNAQTKLKGKLSYSLAHNHSGDATNLCAYSYTPEGFTNYELYQFKSDGLAATGGLAQRVAYEYNLRGTTTNTIVDDKLDNTEDFVINHAFDGRNRLYYVTPSVAGINPFAVAYNYNNALGLLNSKQYVYSCSGSSAVLNDIINYTYDVRDRLTLINGGYFSENLYYDNNLPQTGTTVYDVTASKNYNGNINAIKATYYMSGASNYSSIGNSMDGETHYGYTYDGMNRLTKADASVMNVLNNAVSSNPALKYGDETYSYDKIGNITTLQRGLYYLPNSTPGNAVTAWDYNYTAGTNKLVMLDSFANNLANYTYDANGNLRSDSKKKILNSNYGRGNLPVYLEIDKPGIGPNDILTYIYDVNDNRVYKENILTAQSTGEYYLHDVAGRTIGIYNTATTTWNWFAFGMDRLAKIDEAGNSEMYTNDHLGNTRVTYSASLNCATTQTLTYTINNASDYYAGGKVLRSFAGSGQSRYGYQSSEREKEISDNDYYTLFRGLDTDILRWKHVDPKWNQSWSPYVSMNANPVIYTDVLGDIVDYGKLGEGGLRNRINSGLSRIFSSSYRQQFNAWQGSATTFSLNKVTGMPSLKSGGQLSQGANANQTMVNYNPFEGKPIKMFGTHWAKVKDNNNNNNPSGPQTVNNVVPGANNIIIKPYSHPDELAFTNQNGGLIAPVASYVKAKGGMFLIIQVQQQQWLHLVDLMPTAQLHLEYQLVQQA